MVADLHRPESFENLRAAWIPEDEGTSRAVRHEPIDLTDSSWLRRLMDQEAVQPTEVAVVSCHACGVLADSLIDVCTEARVDFAVMPCCHPDAGLAHASRELGLDYSAAVDLARYGVIASRGYKARLRFVNPAITPMNRILVASCLDTATAATAAKQREKALARVSTRWQRIYRGHGRSPRSLVRRHTDHLREG